MTMYCSESNEPCAIYGNECPYYSHIECSTVHEMYGPGFHPSETLVNHAPADQVERAKTKKSLKGVKFTTEELRQMPYEQYLLTEHWQKIKKTACKRVQYKCEKCGQNPGRGRLHVHHLTYVNRGNEKPEDLQVLCDVCHKKEHEDD